MDIPISAARRTERGLWRWGPAPLPCWPPLVMLKFSGFVNGGTVAAESAARPVNVASYGFIRDFKERLG